MPAAPLDMIDAQDWYERHAPGLGARFRAELGFQLDRVARSPLHFPVVLADVHRARLQRFPYGLFFRAIDDEIFVIACFHSSRDPLVWRARI